MLYNCATATSYGMKTFSKSTILGLTLGVFLAAYAVFAFDPPVSTPPGGNVPAPLNVGIAGQEKQGGLILNTGGAEFGLIVAAGTVDIASNLCLGGECKSTWPGIELKSAAQSSPEKHLFRTSWTTLETFTFSVSGARQVTSLAWSGVIEGDDSCFNTCAGETPTTFLSSFFSAYSIVITSLD